WLVLHSYLSFSQHPDMIGVESSRDYSRLVYPSFSRIRKNDEVVYYAIRDCVIVGVFKVVSDMKCLNDKNWGPVCVYGIAPLALPPTGKVLDFRFLVRQSRFDLFPSSGK